MTFTLRPIQIADVLSASTDVEINPPLLSREYDADLHFTFAEVEVGS
ncbi:hypothetical protein ACP26L_07495 [Paenibacillus sp. S-38]